MKKKFCLFCLFIPLAFLGLSCSHSEQQFQENDVHAIDLSGYPDYLDFQECLLSDSNIPRESYMPVKYIGYLTQQEFESCAQGCEQRTKALLLFLKDIYSGDKKVIRDGVIPKEIVDYALKTQGFKELIGLLPPENIAITCGSDINLKKNIEGKVVVIEDNIGSLGGREEIYAITDVFRKTFQNIPIVDSYALEEKYIRDMKKWYKHLPGEYLIYCSDVMRPEETFAPKPEIVEKIGVHLANQDGVYVQDDRLFLQSTQKDCEDIEISVLEHNGLDYSLDLEYEVFRKRCEDLDVDVDFYQDIPGSMNAVLKGNLILGHAPGSSLADSKIIYPFVEDFIRYYLHEEPILASTKTYGLQVDGTSLHNISSLSFEEATARKDELVLKPIMGECGQGVVVGRNMGNDEWKQTLLTIYSNTPEDFLFFEYVEILQEENHLLIHRFFVDAFQEHVSTRPGAYIRMKDNDSDGVVSTGNPGTVATGVLIENIHFLNADKELLFTK